MRVRLGRDARAPGGWWVGSRCVKTRMGDEKSWFLAFPPILMLHHLLCSQWHLVYRTLLWVLGMSVGVESSQCSAWPPIPAPNFNSRGCLGFPFILG